MGAFSSTFGGIFKKDRSRAPRRNMEHCLWLCTHVFCSWTLYKLSRMSLQRDMNGIGLVISLCAIGSMSVYPIYRNYLHSYWRKRKMPTYPTSARIFDVMKTIMQRPESIGEQTRNMYRHFRENDQTHGGAYFFSIPVYIPADEDLSRDMMTTNFKHFQSRAIFSNIKNDAMSGHLFILEGVKWKNLREKLSRFTINMDSLLEISMKPASELAVIMDELAISGEAFELRDLVDRYAIDVIGNCALDLQCNALRDPDNTYKRYREMLPKDSTWQSLVNHLTYMLPNCMRFPKRTPAHKGTAKLMHEIIRKEVEKRETFNLGKCDYLHVLLQLKNRGDVFPNDKSIFSTGVREADESSRMEFTFNDLLTQTYLFFFAGFETFASTMTFCLYELAKNPLVQLKLKREIRSKMRRLERSLTLNDFNAASMPYLHAVIQETLRKYPAVPVLHRTCTKEYDIPGTKLRVPEGTQALIPVWGMQSDGQIYENPDQFDPTRFLKADSNRETMSFGLGERNCLGQDYALMETKLGIIHCLKEHAVDCEARSAQPVKMDSKSFILAAEGDILLKSFSG